MFFSESDAVISAGIAALLIWLFDELSPSAIFVVLHFALIFLGFYGSALNSHIAAELRAKDIHRVSFTFRSEIGTHARRWLFSKKYRGKNFPKDLIEIIDQTNRLGVARAFYLVLFITLLAWVIRLVS